MRRVVITGMGMISALGRNVPENWATLVEGKSGIGPIQAVDTTNLKFKNGAEIRNFNPEEHSLKPEFLDRFAQLAAVSAREAVKQSGLSFSSGLGDMSAVITGSSMGGQDTQDAGFVELYGKNNQRMHPMSIPRTMANAGASHIATEFGIRGPVYTI
jgi:nodulation protein E